MTEYITGINKDSVIYNFNLFKKYFCLRKGNHGTNALELGPAEGTMTELLYSYFNELTVIDCDIDFCKMLEKRFPHLEVWNNTFENIEIDLQTLQPFDNIIITHVLEHVDNPKALLEKFKNYLSEEGKLLITVPNSHSLHRQLGVSMGLLKHEKELNETDLKLGHKRVYDLSQLQQIVIEAGLKVINSGGYWLKMQPNKELENNYNKEIIQAHMQLGERYPNIAAEIYVIASK